MGFGSAFTSAWNKASNAVQRKVAQVATTAKQVTTTVVNKAQNVAQQAQKAANFVAQQTAKVAQTAKKAIVSSVNTAQKAVTNAVQTVKTQVAQAVQVAKKNIPIIAEKVKQKAKNVVVQTKQTLNKAKNTAKAKVATLSKKVNTAFKKVKKAFSPKNLVKKAVQVCPLAREIHAIVGLVKDGKDVAKNNASRLSKGLSFLSLGISGLKNAKDFIESSNVVYKAARYGPNNPIVALAKNNMRGVPGAVAFDMAISGLTGGLDNLAKNIDRKDISNANKAGRVAFGALKGATKTGLAAGMGAATGAAIGAVLGSVVPGAGTAAGAVLGAKLGASLLSPLFEKPAEKLTEKVFTQKNEDRAGNLGDKVSSSVKGLWSGTLNLIRPPT